MRPVFALPLVLMACAPPDVGPLVQQIDVAFKASGDAGRPALATAASAELRDAEDARIAQGEEVMDLTTGCALRINDPTMACELDSFATVTADELTATQALALESVIAEYLAAIGALADPAGAQAVATSLDRLITADAALREARGATGQGALTHQANRLRAISSLLTDQARARALRRIVPEARGAIVEAAASVAGWHDARPGGPDEMLAALLQQRDAVERARSSGNRAAHRAAIDKLKSDFATYETAVAGSPGQRLREAVALHADLVAALEGRVSADVVLDAAERVKRIAENTDPT